MRLPSIAVLPLAACGLLLAAVVLPSAAAEGGTTTARASAPAPTPAPTPASTPIAGAVGDALDRPALMVRQPARSVLLGAARAGNRVVAVGERGVVVVSDDQGRQWRQVPCPVSVTLTAVRFADARHGVAVGHGGSVLVTADAGETWTLKLDGRRIGRLALEAARAGGDPTRLKEAELLVKDGPDKPLLDVLLQDARRLFVVGAYGIALASDDGGERWTPWMARIDNPRGLHLYALRRQGDTVVIAGEQGLLLHSADAGAQFKRVELPYKGSLFAAELLSGSDWLVAGLRGNAWRSVDAGAHWTQVATPMPASITATERDAGGAVWAVNQAGFVLRLQPADGGFEVINRSPLPPLAGVLSGRPATAVAGQEALGLLTVGLGGAAPVATADAATGAPR